MSQDRHRDAAAARGELKKPRTDATTAAYSASARAVTAQVVAFYFRSPVKAFFRTRVDYLNYVRAIILEEQRLSAQPSSSWVNFWRATTPGVLVSAVRRFGWGIIPQQIAPPLVANVAVGAVLYTSYLQILGRLHEQSSQKRSRVFPPPSPWSTAAAGFVAGGIQSVVAAPLDAIQARFDTRVSLAPEAGKQSMSMWAFSSAKLREIGLRGMFAGWGMSFAKDSFGSALFFSTFEYVKAQGFYRFVGWYYGRMDRKEVLAMSRQSPHRDARDAVIRPHFALEPFFLLLAGSAASVVQQLVIHPLTRVQMQHWEHLEVLDAQAMRLRTSQKYPAPAARQFRMFRAYLHAYQQTFAGCLLKAQESGLKLRSWLYKDFVWTTVRQIPSTSAGLIIFELVRRRYGSGGGETRLDMGDYDIIV